MKGIKMRVFLMVIILPLLLGGCAVSQAIKNNVQGTHYLQTKNYSEGVTTFRETVTLDPDNAQANYYLGRFLLADEQPKQALPYLQKAASLDRSSGSAA